MVERESDHKGDNVEIEKVVQDKFAEIVSSGFVEEQIKKHLEQTVASAISDCLKSYSDFGKNLEKKMKEALGLGNMNFSLPEYNQLVTTWVLDLVNRQIVDIGKAQIEVNLKKFFNPLEKSEWKISEIIEKFKDGLSEDGESGEITFISEPGAVKRYRRYYFDEDSLKDSYRCAYSIATNEDGVYAAKINDKEAAGLKSPTLYNFDSFMFQLFATKAKIIDDSGSVETYYGHEYD